MERELREIYQRGENECVAWMLKLANRVAALEARVSTNSRNSSKPPSQDPYKNTKKKKKQRRSKRHTLGGRRLRPVVEVDKIIDVYPGQCRACALALSSKSQHVGAPSRSQQVEVPAPTATLTEYRRHACKCQNCGVTTRAALPLGASGSLGARLRATIAMLTVDKRQSARQTQEFLHDFYGINVSIGAISGVVQSVGELVAPAREQLKAGMLNAIALYADETSWPITDHDHKGWLWGLFSRDAAYYEVNASRGATVASELIPAAYAGVVHTDCYGGYNNLRADQRQVCFAHLQRHFQAHAERGEPARAFGERGLVLCQRAFEFSKQSTQAQREQLVADMDTLVALGLRDEATRAMATTLVKHKGSLWHCLGNPSVEATNNHAERMLRPAVIKRKLSFGSGSERGGRAFAALLSVITTMRLRGENPYSFIERTVRAAQLKQPLPELA